VRPVFYYEISPKNDYYPATIFIASARAFEEGDETHTEREYDRIEEALPELQEICDQTYAAKAGRVVTVEELAAMVEPLPDFVRNAAFTECCTERQEDEKS